MEKDLSLPKIVLEEAMRDKKMNEEMGRVQRQLKEERENGEKLRKKEGPYFSQRESRQTQKELEAYEENI